MNPRPEPEEQNVKHEDKDKAGKRKCLHHPAMQCPSPNEPCVFAKTEEQDV